MRDIEIKISEYINDDISDKPIKKRTVCVAAVDLGTDISDEILEKCFDKLFVDAKNSVKNKKFTKCKEEKWGTK